MNLYALAVALLLVLFAITAVSAYLMGVHDAKKVKQARWDRHVNRALNNIR